MKALLLAYYLSVYSTVAFPGVGFVMPDQYYFIPDGPENAGGSVTVYDPATGYIQSTGEIHTLPIAFGVSPADIQPNPTEFGSSDVPSFDGRPQFGSDTAPLPASKTDKMIASLQSISQQEEDLIEKQREVQNALKNLVITIQNDSS
ncbi:uncharacterized protein LOC129574510 [Sitodiplosis mosellana]|uniref:uncharacterized protein LOC129574510 n=1 Tax=Sitodiplosis mosellana TaxID=263140 RepID=UPI0024450228|nr:uncharacterized protein LOC129574510 [Sitodiplosis mosellana]